jgi:Fe-S cluster biogenesis protein NfuA
MSTDPTAAGERIELLLEAMSAHGPVVRERAEELVRLVVELYGAGLERLLDLAHDAGRLDDRLLAALAGDELVASLLLVHGLHPYGVSDRVRQALATVHAQGTGVQLLDVTEGVVTVALLEAAHGCGSGADPAQLVRDAVAAAAPEVERVEVVPAPRAAAVIPVDALSARLRPDQVLT